MCFFKDVQRFESLTSHPSIEASPKVAIDGGSGCVHKDGGAQHGATPGRK